jgi:gamma-glutamyl-gamma-aminobutyrate hydrolase PuuD
MFNYTDYILEVNDNFIRWAGSRTVAIPFDISDADLNRLLPQINGVLLTGGALDLYDSKSDSYH